MSADPPPNSVKDARGAHTLTREAEERRGSGKKIDLSEERSQWSFRPGGVDDGASSRDRPQIRKTPAIFTHKSLTNGK